MSEEPVLICGGDYQVIRNPGEPVAIECVGDGEIAIDDLDPTLSTSALDSLMRQVLGLQTKSFEKGRMIGAQQRDREIESVMGTMFSPLIKAIESHQGAGN